MINSTLLEGIEAAFCARHHIAGDHKPDLCPLPVGYCNVIGQLARETVLLEGKNQKLRNAGPAHGLAVGMGGSGGSNAVSSGGAGGGRGY